MAREHSASGFRTNPGLHGGDDKSRCMVDILEEERDQWREFKEEHGYLYSTGKWGDKPDPSVEAPSVTSDSGGAPKGSSTKFDTVEALNRLMGGSWSYG